MQYYDSIGIRLGFDWDSIGIRWDSIPLSTSERAAFAVHARCALGAPVEPSSCSVDHEL